MVISPWLGTLIGRPFWAMILSFEKADVRYRGVRNEICTRLDLASRKDVSPRPNTGVFESDAANSIAL